MANQYDIVRAAVAVDGLGGRYVWGAKGPKNFDCSGFTWEVGRRCGSSLVHGAQNQRDQLRPARLAQRHHTRARAGAHRADADALAQKGRAFQHHLAAPQRAEVAQCPFRVLEVQVASVMIVLEV